MYGSEILPYYQNSGSTFPGPTVIDNKEEALESDRRIFHESELRVQEYFLKIDATAQKNMPSLAEEALTRCFHEAAGVLG